MNKSQRSAAKTGLVQKLLMRHRRHLFHCERQLLCRYYGLDGGRPRSLRELAEDMYDGDITASALSAMRRRAEEKLTLLSRASDSLDKHGYVARGWSTNKLKEYIYFDQKGYLPVYLSASSQ